jgi:hypothetical protein
MSDNADDNQGRATRRVKASMMDDIESYVQRGRRYQGLSEAKLLEMCVAALLRFERAPHEINPGLMKDRLDIACEMQLRGIEPPAELLECAFFVVCRSRVKTVQYV